MGDIQTSVCRGRKLSSTGNVARAGRLARPSSPRSACSMNDPLMRSQFGGAPVRARATNSLSMAIDRVASREPTPREPAGIQGKPYQRAADKGQSHVLRSTSRGLGGPRGCLQLAGKRPSNRSTTIRPSFVQISCRGLAAARTAITSWGLGPITKSSTRGIAFGANLATRDRSENIEIRYSELAKIANAYQWSKNPTTMRSAWCAVPSTTDTGITRKSTTRPRASLVCE